MKAEILNIFGDDMMAVNAARVSFGKQSENYSEQQNARLINRLAKDGHNAPFFHPKIQFRIECPIYVERQIFKTQVGVSVNSISGRYVDFSDTYTLIPEGEWRLQSKDNKQGSAGLANDDVQYVCNKCQQEIIKLCKDAYDIIIQHGVSKEQARTILPLNLNTEFIWTGSLYAFIRLCHLRLKDDTQKETRDLVADMLRLVKADGRFKHSLKAFGL